MKYRWKRGIPLLLYNRFSSNIFDLKSKYLCVQLIHIIKTKLVNKTIISWTTSSQ